uniref:hypothetical protein n=1 Tax=Gracilaria bursa-pastoris TaxID=172962 RepID=UPI001D12ABC7|nr:hypothetical protein LK221_pgp124 [Gracilaria bursa-pastoris]UAD83328.1 hypothetical protein [Gracilaria bursa-pastoris]
MPLILLHLLFMIIYSLHYNSKKIRYLDYYAMVSSIYFKEKSKSPELSHIQIKINRCNKYLLQKIRPCKQARYNKIRNFNLNNKNLEKYIHILKNSGCIRAINKHTILYAKYKQTIFDVNIYPIIDQINIKEYKKLKICPKFLKTVFKQQLGLPKNHLLINYILHKIHTWYLLRGYRWSSINVEVISQMNKLNFIINEGIIHSVHIECKTKQIKKNLNELNNLIIKNLSLLPKQILNLHKLESSISFLKKERVIKNCTYNVITYPEGLIIHVKYNLCSQQIRYIYNQENINIWKKNDFIFLKHIKYIIKAFQFQYSRNLLNKFIAFKSKKSYILEFKHHWNFIKNLQIKLNHSTTLTKINIKLSLSQIMSYYINIYFSYTYYIIYCYKFTYNYNYIQILNSNFFLGEISNLRMTTQDLKIKLQYNLKNQLNIIQKLALQYEEKHFISIYNYSYKNITINSDHYSYNISKLKNSKELYFLLNHSSFQYSDTPKYSAIYLHLLFYDNIKTSKWMNCIINLYPYITCTYNRVFNLISVLPWLHKNTIQIKGKINIFDITQKLISIKPFDNFHNKDEYNTKKNIYNFKLINITNYLFNIQYTMYLTQYISIYLLINHIKSISYQILYLPDTYLSKSIYQNHNRVSIGVNIYIPFKQKPIIFIEYFTNDKYENIIYIGTNFS